MNGVGLVDGAGRVLREQRERLAALYARADELVASMLETARGLEQPDRAGAAQLLELAELVGRREQAAHGQLIQMLAQADRVRAARGGVKAWVATRLDVTDGRAKAIGQAARRIGAVPELAQALSSGRIGTGTVGVLARTARAIEGTSRDKATALSAALETVRRDGVAAANRRVRVLEQSVDPDAATNLVARARARSFCRITPGADGLCRVEALLDTERATVLRAAIDAQVADWIRQRQYDSASPLAKDVRTIEQMNAQALARLAEVFSIAPAQLRGAAFSPTMLFIARPGPETGAPFIETAYGEILPPSTTREPGDPATHVLELDTRDRPVRLDGKNIDSDPGTRLALPAQRTALQYRDRHCRFPGCTRPTTFSLHAHHQLPYSKGGPTIIDNLVLYCAEHHTLIHQEQHPEQGRNPPRTHPDRT